MSKIQTGSKGKLVWAGRPSVSVFYVLYGVIALVVIAVLVVFEYWFTTYTSIGPTIFPSSISAGGVTIPYPVELLTVLIILIAYLAQITRLALLRARNKYELYEDGLYIDSGIVNLQNTFLSPMAFSDARLFRNWAMRIVNRGLIIVDANDGRKFNLLLIEKAVMVQDLIRRTLAHPVVRVESNRDLPPEDKS
ncbi:MAG: hypothetical protein ACHQ1H_10375 [Nitrososphaerales archaeon]